MGEDMQAQVCLDEELLQHAQSLIGVKDYNMLLNQALTVLIQQESARQLAKLSGSQPSFECTPRHCEIE